MPNTNYVCNSEGKIIGEYFYDADRKCFVAIPCYLEKGELPFYRKTAISAIDVIEEVYKEGA